MKLWRQTALSRTPGTGVGQKERSMARSQSTSLARFVTHYVRTLLKPGSTFATFLCTHTNTHKYILMLILFQKISQPKLVRSHSRLPFGFNHQPQRQQKRLHIFIINAPRLALQAPQHPQAKPGKPSRASQADTGPDRSSQLNCLSSLSLSLPLLTLSLSLSLLLPGFVR